MIFACKRFCCSKANFVQLLISFDELLNRVGEQIAKQVATWVAFLKIVRQTTGVKIGQQVPPATLSTSQSMRPRRNFLVSVSRNMTKFPIVGTKLC